MQKPGALAYFIDESDLAELLPDWPEDMKLVLCLDEHGGCDMLVHHRDEEDRVLARVAALLRRPAGGFSVVPERPGHPTLRILFSERQQLLTLVSGAERLLETASDYAINYRFALEEGLDPQVMTDAAVGRRVPERQDPSTPAPWFSFAQPERRATEPPSEPPRESVPDLPPGYAPASVLARRGSHLLPARLEGAGGRIRLVLEPGKGPQNAQPLPVAQIGLRDDFQRFVLPRRSLDGWTPGAGALLDIPASQFPEALATRFCRQPHAAEAVVTPAGVFVTPGAALPPGEAPPQRRPRRLITPFRLALAGLAAVGLVSGTVVSAWQDTTPPPRPGPVQPGAPDHAALTMIESFARADSRDAAR
ncbi:hypothetical protein [Actibacterium sp. MT2.3-13A]|uniref:hypothetical protein n=1 Tax=Actibacterium sp. MT2.3-13A TaxID=2828332 RepID=UPI001BAAE0DF|nr:hypothetical protein [Actibacterium sp. MT2.3-13A]